MQNAESVQVHPVSVLSSQRVHPSDACTKASRKWGIVYHQFTSLHFFCWTINNYVDTSRQKHCTHQQLNTEHRLKFVTVQCFPTTLNNIDILLPRPWPRSMPLLIIHPLPSPAIVYCFKWSRCPKLEKVRLFDMVAGLNSERSYCHESQTLKISEILVKTT